jgi:hypothetical protein
LVPEPTYFLQPFYSQVYDSKIDFFQTRHLIRRTVTGLAEDEIFDVAKLSAAVFQSKYKTKADTKAEHVLRPIRILSDIHALPYLAVLLELGNEFCPQETGTWMICLLLGCHYMG